jgi:protein-disulfide isomerase
MPTPTPSRLSVPVTPEDHIQGPPDASVTLVEYGDFQCPHCGRAYPIIKSVLSHFKNDLRFVYRHFPLIDIHPLAEPAAETAEFAGTHGLFWDMHNLLFENQDQLSVELLAELTDELGLDTRELASALQQGLFVNRVKRDIESGLESGVQGTPTLFINGEQHVGTYEFKDLVYAIEQHLEVRRKRAS